MFLFFLVPFHRCLRVIYVHQFAFEAALVSSLNSCDLFYLSESVGPSAVFSSVVGFALSVSRRLIELVKRC